MYVCPNVRKTINRVNNTYLIYNIIHNSGKLPPEIVEYIFSIIFLNGCAILYDGTIVDTNINRNRGLIIFISYAFNTERVLKQELIFPNLLSVIIHNNISKIETNTFYGSELLTNPGFHDNITHISHYAFHGCKNLTTIELPKNLKKLGEKAFANCVNLKEIKFNDNIQYLGEYIIMNTKVENIELPKSVKVIDRFCFLRCEGIKSIKIHNKFRVNDMIHSYWDDKNDDFRLNNEENNNEFMVINTGAFWCNNIELRKISLPMSRIEITEPMWNQIFPKDTYRWNEIIVDLGNGEKEYNYIRDYL